MRRLARHLFALGSAASLLLCVAVCVLWVRSYDTLDEWWWTSTREPGADHIAIKRRWWITTSAGGVWFARDVMPLDWADEPFTRSKHTDDLHRESSPAIGYPAIQPARGAMVTGPFATPHRSRRPVDFGGFVVQDTLVLPSGNLPAARYTAVIVPIWTLAAGLFVLPLWCTTTVYRRHRAAGRERRSLCRHCGYDLRASPGRCPECGAEAHEA